MVVLGKDWRRSCSYPKQDSTRSLTCPPGCACSWTPTAYLTGSDLPALQRCKLELAQELRWLQDIAADLARAP